MKSVARSRPRIVRGVALPVRLMLSSQLLQELLFSREVLGQPGNDVVRRLQRRLALSLSDRLPQPRYLVGEVIVILDHRTRFAPDRRRKGVNEGWHRRPTAGIEGMIRSLLALRPLRRKEHLSMLAVDARSPNVAVGVLSERTLRDLLANRGSGEHQSEYASQAGY